MSLLPDLDSAGNLKPEPRTVVIPSKSKREQKFLRWENVLDNCCPSCDSTFPQTSGDRICTNHTGPAFRIPERRFIELKRDLQEKQDFKMPRF